MTLFRDWDRVRPTSQCGHCNGTGRAPGDGRKLRPATFKDKKKDADHRRHWKKEDGRD